MKAVAHPFACSHLPRSGHTDRIKALPPSSMKTFLPLFRPSQRITLQITRRSRNTLVAVDNNNNRVSAPTPAGDDELPPLGSYEEELNSPLPNNYCPDLRKYDINLINYEEMLRAGRESRAALFRIQYTYGNVKDGCNNSKEHKTCIWPEATLSWQDESSGIMWVGVYGRSTVCVVSRNEDLDEVRLGGVLKQFQKSSILSQFMGSIIVEIEDLAGQSSKICERYHTRITKPFGVVNVIPDAYKSHKGSGDEASSIVDGETKATEFLQEKVKNRRFFTATGTIQAAIAAFQQLFQKKFKADEIKVSVVDPMHFNFDNNGIQSLTTHHINEHLAVINKPGFKDSRMLWEHYYAIA